MKRILFTVITALAALPLLAQGWPSQYEDVMLQGFYWDSFDASKWTKLESQADELSRSFSLVWIPQSGNCNGTSMGYDDYFWFPGGNRYNSSFGTEAELRSLIATFKSKGIGTIADVVINHRKANGWFGFPGETYNGVSYRMSSTDVCKNDDNGEAQAEADRTGVSLGAYDTGEGWDGMRDLDHTSQNVQAIVKAYLHMLLEDLGYIGFRYDMVKGYNGSYTGMYNADAKPEFSVGEYWDSNVNNVTTWLRYTRLGGGRNVIESAAFDFPFRYTVRDAVNKNDWSQLKNNSIAKQADYRRYAVTFVENHDTEYRSASAQQDPIRKDTLAANAWLLAYSGTPCVFYKHWLAYKRDISAMIAVRRAVGVHNESTVTPHTEQAQLYAATTEGKNGSMMVAVGNNAASFNHEGYTKVLSGYHYAYFMANTMETAWADVTSGAYNNLEVTLSAVSTKADAQLVYTLDGTTPTPSSTVVASGTKIEIPVGTTTLTVGLLTGGSVSGVISRQYEVSTFSPYTIDIYVNADAVGWNSCNFYYFGGDGSHTSLSWPGKAVTTKQTIDGKEWYCQQYTINSPEDYLQFVFSTGSGSPQTVDSKAVRESTFFEVANRKTNGKYELNQTTGIQQVSKAAERRTDKIYNLNGQQVTNPRHGIFVVNGRKIWIP